MILTPPCPSERSRLLPQVVIVGGGITGLSAAWALQQQARERLRVTVVEQGNRWGGKVQTETFEVPGAGRFTIDAGPESFVTRKPEAWDLAHELDMQDELISPGSETRGMYVLAHGRPSPVPLDPLAFLRSSLLTTRGKLRLLAEPLIPPRAGRDDESLASFVRRRLGREALDAMVGPILAGIYNTDPEQQSLLATAPVMRAMEQQHGSLALGALAHLRRRRRTSEALPPRFFTFAGGAQSLVDRLVQQLTARLLPGTPVEQILDHGGKYVVRLAGGVHLPADVVIVATPADVAARLLQPVAPWASAQLASLRQSSIGTLSLAVCAADLPAGLKVRGLMVPRHARRAIDAVTLTSAKLPERAPEGYALLRVFFGANAPELMDVNEAALLATVRRELKELLGLSARVLDHRAYRWPNGFPQAGVGHLDLVASLMASLPARLLLAGSAYLGVGLPDCIRQGRHAAQRTLELLRDPAIA